MWDWLNGIGTEILTPNIGDIGVNCYGKKNSSSSTLLVVVT